MSTVACTLSSTPATIDASRPPMLQPTSPSRSSSTRSSSASTSNARLAATTSAAIVPPCQRTSSSPVAPDGAVLPPDGAVIVIAIAPRFASATAVSSCSLRSPPAPWRNTTAGSFSPVSGGETRYPSTRSSPLEYEISCTRTPLRSVWRPRSSPSGAPWSSASGSRLEPPHPARSEAEGSQGDEGAAHGSRIRSTDGLRP